MYNQKCVSCQNYCWAGGYDLDLDQHVGDFSVFSSFAIPEEDSDIVKSVLSIVCYFHLVYLPGVEFHRSTLVVLSWQAYITVIARQVHSLFV